MAAPTNTKSPFGKGVKPRSVLFLDDEKSYVDLMTQLLSDHLTTSVFAFNRPVEALAALTRLDIGMIVTDYSMPIMNGYEFIKRAEKVDPQAAAILISGNAIQISEEEQRAAGMMKAFLEKPLSWRTLAEKIVQYWPDENPPKLKNMGSKSA